MSLIKVSNKYREKIRFFESKDVLNNNHVNVFIKGLHGIKSFIVDNNEIFEPIAIEWLGVYCESRLKFNEEIFHTSLIFTTSTIIKILIMEHTSMSFVNDFALSYFEILHHVPEDILARIFNYHKSVFKLLAKRIFNCGIYSHQVTLLELLFRFFSDYRNYQFDDEQNNSPDLVSSELFPDILNKDELIEIFLNMKKSSYDTDSRNFLNKLNRLVKPCKIFSTVAESIILNENKLKAPLLLNQSYTFWIDFNISIYQISFSCKGEDSENGWVANYITKDDLERLIVDRNTTHFIVSVYLKNISNLNSSLICKLDSNLTYKIDFKFISSHDSIYLVNNVLPYYQSYLNSNNTVINVLTPTKEKTTKSNYYQKIITPETIERLSKYDTIIEEQDVKDQQIRANIINYANNTMNSFTFEKSFSKSSSSINNFKIFKDLAPKSIFQKQPMQIESTTPVNKPPLLSNITNKIINTTPSEYKRKKNTMVKVAKRSKPAQNKQSNTDNSGFDQLKSNDKAATNTKRKLYSKQVIENGIKGSQSSKENVKHQRRTKPRKIKKLVNRVIPLQKDTAKKRSNVRNSNYTNSEILQIQANVELINSGIQNSEETVTSVAAIHEISVMNSNLSLSESRQPMKNNVSSVYDITNIRRIETRDEEFVLNVISQVRSQQAPSQTVPRKEFTAATNKKGLIPVVTSTPLGKIKTIDDKNVSHSYRRFAKSKNSSTKLGYNSNIECIEPYNESYLKKSPNQPLRVQGFRQSKAKIKNLREIDSSMDEDVVETSAQIENVVTAEVHLSPQKETSHIEENLSRLSNGVSNNSSINIHVLNNDTPNITIVNQTEKLCENPKLIVSIPKLIGHKIPATVNETPNISIVKNTTKPREEPIPISIPMPILIDEIKTEYIISVDDDSDYENINRDPAFSLMDLEQDNTYLMSIQGHSNLIELTPERPLKRKCLETVDASKNSSEIDERPKQNKKRSPINHEFNEIISMNTNNNNSMSIKKMLLAKPTTKLDNNKRFSNRNELIRYSSNIERPINREEGSKYSRHTISVDTNIENREHQHQLQNLIDMFNQTFENKVRVNEIQTELQVIKKARLDKEKSLAQTIEAKKENLCNKQTKVIRLLGTIKQQENELRVAYANLLKKIEKLTKSINKNRSEIWQEENDINQIKQAERNLAQQLIESITDHSEHIRDEIWRQFVIDLGRNIQQHFFNRYL